MTSGRTGRNRAWQGHASNTSETSPFSAAAGGGWERGSHAGSGDIASAVFGMAPSWVSASHWHCKHPDSVNETSFIKHNGPYSSGEVLQLYKHQQMKGSNLVVGLANTELSGRDIPPAFFRTLAYMFELAKAGVVYQPVTEVDIARGAPLPGWCPPLWMDGEDVDAGAGGSTRPGAMPGGDNAGGRQADAVPLDAPESCSTASGGSGAGAAGGSVPPAPKEAAAATHPEIADAGSDVESILCSCPHWCYLYSHMSNRAKKTPPKTAAQMVAMYRAGSVPDWTPMLGLTSDVATFNSLPPCLFMPLGAIVVGSSRGGRPYRAVGVAELEQWDKFIDSRTASGATQARVTAGGGDRSGDGSSGVSASNASPNMLSPQRSSGAVQMAQQHMGGASAGGGGMYYHHAQVASAAGYLPYQSPSHISPYHNSYMVHNPYVWVSGGYAPPLYGQSGMPHARSHQVAPPMYMQPGVPGMHMHMAVDGADEWRDGVPPPPPPAERSSDQGPIRTPPGRAFRTQLSSPGRMNLPMVSRPRHSSSGFPLQQAHGVADVTAAAAACAISAASSPSAAGGGGRARHSANGLHAYMEADALSGSGRHRSSRSSCSSGSGSGGDGDGETARHVEADAPRACSPVPEAPAAAVVAQAAPQAARWQTAEFRLFTADATRGDADVAWWYLTQGKDATSPTVEGPQSAEHMILAFAHGSITAEHYVCGARVAPGQGTEAQPPPQPVFAPIGRLLEKTRAGHDYVLYDASAPLPVPVPVT